MRGAISAVLSALSWRGFTLRSLPVVYVALKNTIRRSKFANCDVIGGIRDTALVQPVKSTCSLLVDSVTPKGS
jgi:hypothetical protein